MNKKTFFLLVIVFFPLFIHAQIIKSGNITSNETWTNNNTYILNGWVYVKAGATVTIQAGTIIKGDFPSQGALIIERDAKIIAEGTPEMPIVFTSQKSPGMRSYGDWGGIIICGRASVNAPANASLGTQQGEAVAEGGVGAIYGGGPTPNDDDSSGILKYVRIEFAGIAFQPNSEINGLTLCGVGRRTVIDHVQVSYSGDDAFEFFGGTVNCRHLIAYRSWDDDLDMDAGYSGKVQFMINFRDPNIADQSGSNGIECDNDATGTGNTPITAPIISNLSFFGPFTFNSTINSNYKRSMHLRRNNNANIYNSVFCGYPVGLLIESSSTQLHATNNTLQFRNNVLVNMTDTLASTTAANPNNVNGSFNINNWFASVGFNDTMINNEISLQINSLNLSNPDPLIQPTSPLVTGASFTNPNLTDPFFAPTNYIGAFDTINDWTSCWAEWDPQNQSYNTAINYAYTTTAVAGGPTFFCAGDSVNLSVSNTGGQSPFEYTWNNNASTQNIFVTTSGTYSADVTDSRGCLSTTNTIVTNMYPLPTVFAGTDEEVCAGDNILLNATGTASTYTWSNSVPNSSFYTPASSEDLYVTGIDGNNCSNTDTLSIVVNSLPLVDAGPDLYICTGDSILLNATGTAASYTWSSLTINNNYYTPLNTTAIQATGIDTNECSYTDAMNVFLNPLPNVSLGPDIIQASAPANLNAGGGYSSYLWSTAEVTQTINAFTSGEYWVEVTDTNGCVNSDTLQVTFTMSVENEPNSIVNIYPNPAQQYIKIQLSENTESGAVFITDISGKKIWSGILTGSSVVVNIETLSAGTYLITIESAGKYYRSRFIKN